MIERLKKGFANIMLPVSFPRQGSGGKPQQRVGTMKESIGLLVFLAISGSAITLAVKKRTGNALTVILLVFSLVSGLGIANYDWIRKVEGRVPALEPFRKQVLSIKEDAVDEICNEVEAQKASISLLLSNAKEAHEDLEARKESMESLLAAITKLEESAREQEQKAGELNEKAEKMQGQLLAVHRASSELALLLTRVTWLLFEAREEYGAERSQAAIQKIMDGLDEIVNLVIVDPKAREDFVSDVMRSLPPRQQQQ